MDLDDEQNCTSESEDSKKKQIKKTSQEKENGSMDLDPELLDAAPPDVKNMLMMAMRETSIRDSLPNPIFEKVNEDHIHQFLDILQKDDSNQFKINSSNRWFSLFYTVLFLGFSIFLLIFLTNGGHKDLLVDILKAIVIFGGGFGSGLGYKNLEKKKR